MNNKIFKYKLELADAQHIILPKDAEILSAKEQFDNIVIYAFVDEFEQETEKYKIQVRGTGHPAGNFKRENYTFLDTVKMANGALMFHIFYRKE